MGVKGTNPPAFRAGDQACMLQLFQLGPNVRGWSGEADPENTCSRTADSPMRCMVVVLASHSAACYVPRGLDSEHS